VPGRFDPLLAKIIAFGSSRVEALGRLADALDQTVILGLVTNLRFLRWVARQPVLRDGQVRIDTLDRIWPPEHWAAATATPVEAWQAAAAMLVSRAPSDDAWAGGWRLNAPREVRVSSEGETRTVRVEPDGHSDLASVSADGTVFVDVAGRSVAFALAPPPALYRSHRAIAGGALTAGADVFAPMPGSVLQVHVRAGADVEAGQPLVTLEAMKMEHVVPAPTDGSVTEVLVAAGDQVSKDQLLAVIDG